VSYVSPTNSYRGQYQGETEETYALRLIQELDDEFQSLCPETVMTFISEPVGGATAGCLVAPKGYYQGVRKLCDKYGILLILDDVMCSSGRIGTSFAFEQEGKGVYPDLLTLGKGLGSGYTLITYVLAYEKIINILQNKSSIFVYLYTY
jgi:adenosylmethionine-8-amino-7-oxononanoate aminotransferase